ncbi:MAG TPA: alkaline phosphatase family protein [Thermoplasmata archaeon]|nr:alkaline phosphatase family protein [Thermoplasmata archaeon]
MSSPTGPGRSWSRAESDLLRPDPRLGLPMPAYGGRSIPNVAATVARAAGASESDAVPLAPSLVPELDPFRGRRPEGPIVVMLADGWGWLGFDRWSGDRRSPAGARWARLAQPITTVFPTTTVPALVSLASGSCPAQNGVVGYRQFLPRFGVVADLLKMSPVGVPHPETLVGAEWTPALVSAAPSIFRRGVEGTALSREKFQGSGLTRLLYDGAPYVPYATASDLAHLLADLIDRPRPPPVIYTYWDELDTVQHWRGPVDRLVGFEADRLAHLFEYVADQVDPDRARATTVVVSADHGQVALDPARQLRIDLTPEIAREMGRPLAGDRRAGYFSALPGREAALRSALEAGLPNGSRLIAMRDGLAAGLFGPPPYHPEIAARLGDLLALVPVPTGLVAMPPGVPVSPRGEFLGGHGGLTPEELLVPLVAGPLSEFGRAPP